MKTEQVIHKRVEKVRDEEKTKRQDLHVLASSYLGILKQKHGQLMTEQDFHQVSESASDQSKSVNGDAKNGETSTLLKIGIALLILDILQTRSK
jgi:THO complex subunit 2